MEPAVHLRNHELVVGVGFTAIPWVIYQILELFASIIVAINDHVVSPYDFSVCHEGPTSGYLLHYKFFGIAF